jgi:hypothetical protein
MMNMIMKNLNIMNNQQILHLLKFHHQIATHLLHWPNSYYYFFIFLAFFFSLKNCDYQTSALVLFFFCPQTKIKHLFVHLYHYHNYFLLFIIFFSLFFLVCCCTFKNGRKKNIFDKILAVIKFCYILIQIVFFSCIFFLFDE